MAVNHIEISRQQIRDRCTALFHEKNAILDQGESPTWQYDRKILQLLRDILIHTRDHYNQESDQMRLGTLNNIVRTIILFRREFTCLYNKDLQLVNQNNEFRYNLSPEKAEYINLWRDLSFLLRCRLNPGDPTVQQTFPITAVQVNRILQDMMVLIDEILPHEIAGLQFQQLAMNAWNIGAQITSPVICERVRQLDQRRLRFRNMRELPNLYHFVIYRREQFRIQSMLNNINAALALNVNIPSQRMALLRLLQVIGESATPKNLSEPTRRLVNNIDWNLFVRLRNKLSHNEWDIHSNLLIPYLTPANLQNIQNDLTQLRADVTLLQTAHNNVGNSDALIAQHYDPANLIPRWTLRPAAHREFTDFLGKVYTSGVISRAELLQMRQIIGGNIRNLDPALIEMVRARILPIFDRNHAHFNQTRDLLPQFQALRQIYLQEIQYLQNLENTQQQARIAHLNLCHPHLRAFHDHINYSATTYNQNRQQHPASFDALRLIMLIETETEQMRAILQPLDVHDVCAIAIPEDQTGISSPVVGQLFNTMDYIWGQVSPSLRQAIIDIRIFCTRTNKQLHFSIDGLHGVARGELNTIPQNVLFERMGELVAPIREYGKRCAFYNNLANNPSAIAACYMHMARIQKYMSALSGCRDVPAQLFANIQELKALRNYIHHGSDNVDSLNIGAEELMVRYASVMLTQMPRELNVVKNNLIQFRALAPAINALQLHGFMQPPRLNHNINRAPALRRSLSR